MFISKKEKKDLETSIASLKSTLRNLIVDVNAIQADIITLKLGRPVVLARTPTILTSKVSSTINVPKGQGSITISAKPKRGRPVGSKNKEKA